mmetsp:Transcript_21550/g.71266  ORF Transcript_21550/g.71266 Transcript_21550/m.71266 type:complete len:250 (+) Transcript_21550:325-1074(+)
MPIGFADGTTAFHRCSPTFRTDCHIDRSWDQTNRHSTESLGPGHPHFDLVALLLQLELFFRGRGDRLGRRLLSAVARRRKPARVRHREAGRPEDRVESRAHGVKVPRDGLAGGGVGVVVDEVRLRVGEAVAPVDALPAEEGRVREPRRPEHSHGHRDFFALSGARSEVVGEARVELEVPDHVRRVGVGRDLDEVGAAVGVVKCDCRRQAHGRGGVGHAPLYEREAARPDGRCVRTAGSGEEQRGVDAEH